MGDELPWRDDFREKRRPFTVHVTENDDDRIAGTFQGVVFNKPYEETVPRPMRFELLEIAVKGEFDWRRGEFAKEPH